MGQSQDGQIAKTTIFLGGGRIGVLKRHAENVTSTTATERDQAFGAACGYPEKTREALHD